MKTFLQTTLLTVAAAFSTSNAHAQSAPHTLELRSEAIRAQISRITGAEYKRNLFEPAALSNVDIAIDETATVIAAWNPEIDKRLAKATLRKRVAQSGVRKGLVEPALLLMELATITNRPDVPQLLLPAIARVFPSVGSKIKSSLAIPEISARDWQDSVSSLRRETLVTIRKSGIAPTAGLPTVGQQFRKYDPSGLGDMMMGHGSMIWAKFKNNDFDRAGYDLSKKSNIYGISRADVESCYSSCGPAIEHGRKIGRSTGVTVGPVAGAMVGVAVTWEAGPVAVAGAGKLFYEGGQKLGPPLGEAAGGAIATVQCMSRCSGEENPPVSSNPPPKSEDHEGDSHPAPPESHPAPRTDSGNNTAGGIADGKDCHTEACTTATPGRDDDGGGSSDDTGKGRHISAPQVAAPAFATSKAPWVNPVRDAMDSKSVQSSVRLSLRSNK